MSRAVPTCRLLCSSVLVMTCSQAVIVYYPKKKELHRSLQDSCNSAVLLKRPEQLATMRLECSSFLVRTHSLLRDYDILPKNGLRWSLWVKIVEALYLKYAACMYLIGASCQDTRSTPAVSKYAAHGTHTKLYCAERVPRLPAGTV